MAPTKDRSSKIDDGNNNNKTTSIPTRRVIKVKLRLTAMCDSWLSFALRGFFLEGFMLLLPRSLLLFSGADSWIPPVD